MSKYVSARAIAQANVQAQICSALSVEPDGVAALARARRFLASTRAEVPAMSEWLDFLEPSARETLDSLVPGSIASAGKLLAHAGAARTVGTESQHVSAAAALELLRSSLTAAEALLATATRDALVDLTAEFARSRNFAGITAERGDKVAVFDLRRRTADGEEQIVFVQVGDDGSVVREYEGTGENGCQVIDAEFVEFMRSHGVELVTTAEDLHRGRRPGARLIRDAAARDSENPARGAVLNVEQPLSVGGSVPAVTGSGATSNPSAGWASTPLSEQRQARRSAGAA